MPLDVPLNLTEVTQNIQILVDHRCFNMKKLWGNNKKKGEDEDEYVEPTVYFSFAISCDKLPVDVVMGMGFEWSRMNGQKLMIKDLPSFKTETPVAIYHLHNNGHMPTLTKELTAILTQARDVGASKEIDGLWQGNIPLTTWRKNVPRIPGQDTSKFKGWAQRLQYNRKVLHIECDKGHSKIICNLVEVAKDEGLFKRMWGSQVHAAAVVDKETTAGELKRLTKMSQTHTNFHSSMTTEDLIGISDLDAVALVYSVSDPTKKIATMSLMHILYKYLKLKSGFSLVAEIHQQGTIGAVEVLFRTHLRPSK